METGSITHPPLDPLLEGTELPHAATFYPGGFPVRVSSNSPEVLECARESWGMFGPEFACEPVDVRVVVQDEGELAQQPEFRASGHLFSVVSDRHNYAVLDLDRLFAFAFVSRRTLRDHAWFRWYFLDLMGLFLISQRHVAAVHAACVAREGKGILLSGESCAGKSTLAWACARAGWSYVSDDACWLPIDGDGREVLGWSHQVRFRDDAPGLFPELEGLISRIRPNGKLSIEVPTAAFPAIRTASRTGVGAVVFLDRSGRREPGYEPVPAEHAAELLLGELAMHREVQRARYRKAVERLLEHAPAYRLRYRTLEEGIALVGELHAGLR